MGAPVTPSYTQTRFRFRNDDGSQTSATWKAVENTGVSQAVNQVFRLRIQVAQTISNANQGLSKNFKVRFSLNSGAYADVAAIGATTAAVRYASSANVTDGATTTSQLTAASGTFLAGRIDNNNDTGTLTFNIEQYTDLEFVLELYGPLLAANDAIDFRVYETGNNALDIYTNTARATAVFFLAPNAPTLSAPDDQAEIAGASEQTFTWQFSSDEPGDSQTAFAFSREGLVSGWTKYTDVPASDGVVQSSTFNPEGSLLACGTKSLQDSSYIIVFNTADWSVVSPGPVLPHIGTSQSTWDLQFSPNGAFLAAVHTHAPGIKVYNTSDWAEPNSSLTLGGSSYGASFHPDGGLLATVNYTSPYLRVIDTTNWTIIGGTPTLSDRGRGCSYSPDGSLLACMIAAPPFLQVIDTSNWSFVSGVSVPAFGTSCCFSPDGSLLATMGLTDTPFLTVLNTSDWSTVAGTPTLAGSANKCAFTPDGSMLAIGHDNSPFLTLLNTSDWSTVNSVFQPPDEGESVFFSSAADPPNFLLAVGHVGSPNITVLTNELTLQTQYWNGTSWQASEVFIDSTTQGVTFPADSWSDT